MTKLNKLLPSFIITTVLLSGLLTTNAMAHVRWAIDSITPPRTNDTGLKVEPCGGVARTSRSTIFSAGQTIDLVFDETINHPGHYRIAFSPANDVNFDSYVLIDNIPDNTNTGRYVQTVTIPNEICSACTLQLIQVMTTDPNPQPNDFYYSCTDIQITNAGDTTAPLMVNGVMAQPDDGQIVLNWNNPVDDFYQVVILKSINPIFEAPTDGTVYAEGNNINGIEVAYVGNLSTYTATGLVNDTPYYFKLFSQNPRKNYATGVELNATPAASSSGGGNTGNEPGNTGTPDSGGGSVNIVFLIFIIAIRVFAKRCQIRS